MPPRRDLLYVAVQVALLAALALDPCPEARLGSPTWLRSVGYVAMVAAVCLGAAAALQLGTSLTPWPSPRAGGRLVTSGLYAWARHPIYAALVYFGVGLTAATASPWRGLVTGLLWGLFFLKSTYEERLLRGRYPGYGPYAERVGRFGW